MNAPKIKFASALRKVKSICKKVSNAIPQKVKHISTWVLAHFMKDAAVPIVVAIIATTVATNHIDAITKQNLADQRKREIVDAVQNIYIGSNKDWIDSKLGPSTFSGLDKEKAILQNVYFLDSISVRVFFDTDSYTCKAFFITLLSHDDSIKIELPEVYSDFVNNKPLGEFSYYEVGGIPFATHGFVSQGTARAFYAEESYFMSGGNYNIFIFATLDYGIKESEQSFIDQLQHYELPSDDELDRGYTSFHGPNCIDKRDETYPNTYGITSLESELTIDLLSDYDIFDSLQFREMNVEVMD